MRFIVGFLAAVALMVFAGVVYVYSGAFDAAASSPHSALEQWLLSSTMKRSVVARAAGVGEPPHFSDDMIKDGFGHYDEMCTGCHGGSGIERSEIGKGLNPQAPTLADAVKEWTPRQLFWIVKNGVKMTGMPSFGATHDDEAVWSIVAFIQKLPGLSSAQYQRMKQELRAGDHEEMSSH